MVVGGAGAARVASSRASRPAGRRGRKLGSGAATPVAWEEAPREEAGAPAAREEAGRHGAARRAADLEPPCAPPPAHTKVHVLTGRRLHGEEQTHTHSTPQQAF
ncbi:hypothetical protein ABZP36_010996 [Zizania latifolia]